MAYKIRKLNVAITSESNLSMRSRILFSLRFFNESEKPMTRTRYIKDSPAGIGIGNSVDPEKIHPSHPCLNSRSMGFMGSMLPQGICSNNNNNNNNNNNSLHYDIR